MNDSWLLIRSDGVPGQYHGNFGTPGAICPLSRPFLGPRCSVSNAKFDWHHVSASAWLKGPTATLADVMRPSVRQIVTCPDATFSNDVPEWSSVT